MLSASQIKAFGFHLLTLVLMTGENPYLRQTGTVFGRVTFNTTGLPVGRLAYVQALGGGLKLLRIGEFEFKLNCDYKIDV